MQSAMEQARAALLAERAAQEAARQEERLALAAAATADEAADGGESDEAFAQRLYLELNGMVPPAAVVEAHTERAVVDEVVEEGVEEAGDAETKSDPYVDDEGARLRGWGGGGVGGRVRGSGCEVSCVQRLRGCCRNRRRRKCARGGAGGTRAGCGRCAWSTSSPG
jgi:hypothetical protein